jgi:hypothetical protein
MPVDRDRMVGFFGRRYNHLRGADYVADFRHRGDIGQLHRSPEHSYDSLGLFAPRLYRRLHEHCRADRSHLHEEQWDCFRERGVFVGRLFPDCHLRRTERVADNVALDFAFWRPQFWYSSFSEHELFSSSYLGRPFDMADVVGMVFPFRSS